MDAKDHVYNKSLSNEITKEEGLGMVEIVGDFMKQSLTATYFRGYKSIDAICAVFDFPWQAKPAQTFYWRLGGKIFSSLMEGSLR